MMICERMLLKSVVFWARSTVIYEIDVMQYIPDALLIGGAVAVAYGAWLIYPPLGPIVAGGMAMMAGIKLS